MITVRETPYAQAETVLQRSSVQDLECDMPIWFDQLLQNIRDHGSKLLAAAVFTVIGWGVARWRSKRSWARRDFLNRLNFSLNVLQDGKLLIRTLMEKKSEDVFLNQSAVERVLASAKLTTAKNPFLPLPQADYWYFLNQVLNELAEKFATSSLKRDLNLSVTSARYLICLTSESAGEIRTRKVRAMIIRKDQLLTLPTEKPIFESEHHITRWETLHLMKEAYQKQPHLFLEMELGV